MSLGLGGQGVGTGEWGIGDRWMACWSVEAFYGLICRDLTDNRGLVELIEGRIVPLPVDEQQDRQVERLRQQIQGCLEQVGVEDVEVRSHYPIQVNRYSELKPTLAVLSLGLSQPQIHWVIDIDKAEIVDSRARTVRAHLYAHYGIGEYWTLSVEQVELRTHHGPRFVKESNEQIAQYQQHRLWHVGEQVRPLHFSQLSVQVQEPLPLHFVMRTATGHCTYTETMLPLKVQC